LPNGKIVVFATQK